MTARAQSRPRFHITRHASDRFVKRIRPDLDQHGAFELLRERLGEAVFFGVSKVTAAELWRIASLDTVLVTKSDRCAPGVTAIVTVVRTARILEIDPNDPAYAEAIEEVIESARRVGALKKGA